MTAWMVIIAAGAGSYLFRVGLVAMMDRTDPPQWLPRVAGYVVPAAFAGLAAVALEGPVEQHAPVAVPLLLAVGVTGFTARHTTPTVALAAGLPVLWIGAAIVGAG